MRVALAHVKQRRGPRPKHSKGLKVPEKERKGNQVLASKTGEAITTVINLYCHTFWTSGTTAWVCAIRPESRLLETATVETTIMKPFNLSLPNGAQVSGVLSIPPRTPTTPRH